MAEEIKIIHISDLHISEDLLEKPSSDFKLPHRFGHDVQAFFALDLYLRENEWDLLLITGDISRIGNRQSFFLARNWLEHELVLGARSIGLNLAKDENREYLIIPGNHDRFNGGLKQQSLEKYSEEFEAAGSGKCAVKTVRGQRVACHIYDSTWDRGGFALGDIEDSSLVPKECRDDELHLAMLHHHFLQPPGHERSSATELNRSARIAAYFLNAEFHGVFFGHTHEGYIGTPNAELLSQILQDKRTTGKVWRKFIPQWLVRKQAENCLVSYPRKQTKSGQFPTLESYFEFVFLSARTDDLKGPEQFQSVHEFYAYMDNRMEDESLKKKLDQLKVRQMLVSLAPSACQAEARSKGFHEITFTRKDSNHPYQPTWKEVYFDGAKYKASQENAG